MIIEHKHTTISGFAMIVVLALAQGLTLFPAIHFGNQHQYILAAVFGVLAFLVTMCWFGFFMIQPKKAVVLQLFGKYVGSAKKPGLRWANPLLTKKHVSLRVRNFETKQCKVNDKMGNPIEIAAVVVWKVVDSAEACFEVNNYENFVTTQSESALRQMASSYSYDSANKEVIALRSHGALVAEALQKEIQARLSKAGVEVIEARISHLAYAPEIASAMLRRQQAKAVIDARNKIVEGAVGMVEMALTQLSDKNVVEFDEERKAAMVSNLLVILCGEQNATPVLNTGSLYT